MKLSHALSVIFLVLSLRPSSIAFGQEAPQKKTEKVEATELGDTRNVHKCGDLHFAGQFTPEDIEKIKSRGIKRVVSLRGENEIEWDEKALVEKAGLEFVRIPFREPDTLTDEVFHQIRALLETEPNTLLHCGAANRVGGVWLPYRVLDENVPLETAVQEAREIGLRTPGYEEKALDYIRRHKREESVRPGINESFLDPELDIDRFIGRFEVESREVFSSRQAVLEACGLEPEWRVADVGAGTGLYTRVFSTALEASGWVYAIDISPRFIQHLGGIIRRRQLRNVTTVLCSEDSIDLPPASIDLAFACDVYHHFEYPKSSLASIHRALKPGGRLIVIDFERIPGESREWLLTHVRAGKDIVRKEIEEAGFDFVEEVEVAEFKENYLLKFRKR